MYRHTSWSLCSYLLSHHSWSWSMSNRNNSLLSMENKENSLWDSCNHEKVITTVQWKKNLLLPFFSMRTKPKSNFWMKTKLISTISFYIVVLNVKIWAIWLETPVRTQQWESIIFIINSIVFFFFFRSGKITSLTCFLFLAFTKWYYKIILYASIDFNCCNLFLYFCSFHTCYFFYS